MVFANREFPAVTLQPPIGAASRQISSKIRAFAKNFTNPHGPAFAAPSAASAPRRAPHRAGKITRPHAATGATAEPHCAGKIARRHTATGAAPEPHCAGKTARRHAANRGRRRVAFRSPSGGLVSPSFRRKPESGSPTRTPACPGETATQPNHPKRNAAPSPHPARATRRRASPPPAPGNAVPFYFRNKLSFPHPYRHSGALTVIPAP